jgi:integrase
MPRKKILDGPIGNGWVEEVRADDGVKFVARWQKYVADSTAPDGRRRESGYHDLGPRVYHGPGLKSKKDAQKKWAAISDSVMGRTEKLPPTLIAEKPFRWFAEEDPDGFRKRREKRWTGGTPSFYEYVMSKILPRFGDTRLMDIREQDLQEFLNRLADAGYSESVVKGCRVYLRAIMAEAVQCRVLDVNPAARIVKPRNTRKPERKWLSVEQFREIIENVTSARDRLMLKLLYILGIRRGELFGLQWHDFDGRDTLYIDRQIREDLSVGPAKTDGSIAPVPVPPELGAELNEWRKWCPDPGENGWIFASPRKAHINPGMWREDVLVPAGKAVGIENLNFPMFRRGFATEAKQQGAGDKNIQGQLRHASVNTTRNIYMQTIPIAQREAVEKFAELVTKPVKTD